jgi:hypothetical protein
MESEKVIPQQPFGHNHDFATGGPGLDRPMFSLVNDRYPDNRCHLDISGNRVVSYKCSSG